MNTTPTAMSSDSAAPVGPPSSRGRWLVVAIAIGLVAVPLLWIEGPAEVSRWRCAAAAEAELDRDYPRALQQVDRAIQWNAADPDLYAYRASLKLHLKDLDGAREDSDRAVTLSSEGSLYALYQRVLVNQRRGDHASALRDVDHMLRMVSDGAPPQVLPTGRLFGMDYDNALNLRAYSCALAEQNIEQGLADIQEAFLRAGTEDIPAYLDTRGYLRYLAGDLAASERDMQRAVTLAEELLDRFRQEEPTGDPRIWSDNDRQLKEDLAVLLHHRGLVQQALKRPTEAGTDFQRAKELGYSPEDGVW